MPEISYDELSDIRHAYQDAVLRWEKDKKHMDGLFTIILEIIEKHENNQGGSDEATIPDRPS